MATTTVTPQGVTLASGSAPVSFVSGGSQVDADVVVEWDFDNDGDFDDPHEDITTRLMSLETFTGRDYPSNVNGEANPGQMRITVDNTDDALSYFNQSSVLNQDGRSLRTGRKIRVRTADSTPADPQLLARDRFDRDDGPLFGSQDELGNDWLDVASAGTISVADSNAVATTGTFGMAGFDLGVTEGYAEASLANYLTNPTGDSYIGVNWRIDDVSISAVSAFLYADRLELKETVSGSTSVLGTYNVTPWEGITIGLSVDANDLATAFIGGVPVLWASTTVPATGYVGLEIDWDAPGMLVTPEVSRFEVWSGTNGAVDGILWTGTVSGVEVDVTPGGAKVATITAEGVLASAAAADVVGPRVVAGAATGVLAGSVLTRAGVQAPPGGGMDIGTVTTGPVAIGSDDGLSMARLFEATEYGFLHETNEGAVGFHERSHRADAEVQAWFSDSGGQYPYSAIAPLNFQQDIVNRVTAGVAQEAPAGITITTDSASTASGVQNNVTVDMPTTDPDDLLVVVIASTVANSDVEWLVPFWWAEMRDDRSNISTRAYWKWCDGNEDGTTVTFYLDSTNSGGAWVAKIIRFTDWFKGHDAVVMGEFTTGHNAKPLENPWGSAPATWIAVNAGLTATTGGGTLDSGATAPERYEGTRSGTAVNGTVNGFDVALQVAYRTDVLDVGTGSGWTGLDNFLINESVLIAVRGYNGPPDLPDKPTWDDIIRMENPGRFVTVDDTQSQRDHNAVISYTDAGNLFATEEDARDYADVVLVAHADDRPIVSISFWASSDTGLRTQAIERRLGHKIHLTANTSTGLGIDGAYFIESISHTITNGAKLWLCTWELSPA